MSIDCCDDSFIEEQIADTKALIRAYGAALLAFANTNTQSYQIDTGQTRQLVTRAQLGSLQLTRSRLMGELATLEARAGCGKFNVKPAW